jgi:hypothetical protein
MMELMIMQVSNTTTKHLRMIKIPKMDIETCTAFHVPHLNGVDIYNFIQAKENSEYNSLRMSSFASKNVFSFEKFQAYIESQNGKVFLEENDKEQLYCISCCDLYELESIIYGGKYPIFFQNYDFENDDYVRRMYYYNETFKSE